MMMSSERDEGSERSLRREISVNDERHHRRRRKVASRWEDFIFTRNNAQRYSRAYPVPLDLLFEINFGNYR